MFSLKPAEKPSTSGLASFFVKLAKEGRELRFPANTLIIVDGTIRSRRAAV